MALAPTFPIRTASLPRPLLPMGVAESLALFGIPALLLVASLYGLQPALIGLGLDPHLSYAFALSLINVGLLVAAIVAYRREGRPMTWRAFAARMRLGRLGAREWKWTGGMLLVEATLSILASSLLVAVYRQVGFWPPSIGGTGGNLALVMAVLTFNILGEELWWRGYILPRQELHFGQRTWLLHGPLWACFHVFKWWAVPGMMLTTWVIPFVAQRLKNTTPGIITHFTLNLLGSLSVLTPLLLRLIGAGS